MPSSSFQFRLSSILVAVACSALVLGAAQGPVVRVFLVLLSAAWVLVMVLGLLAIALAFSLHGAASAGRVARWLAALPWLARRAVFERRLARVRPGHTSQFVRRVLGRPAREDGFGDRLYWSYRVAGQRYTVSFDPRRLVATYSNGLTRDASARSL